jgi:hypothetical protein
LIILVFTGIKLLRTIAINYEVDVQLLSLLKEQPGNTETSQQAKIHLRKQVQNRRFQYLKNVLKGTEYFSEQAMQLREPGLYEYYIGQHLPPHLRNQPYGEDINLVERIMHNLDRSIIDEKLRQQKIIESEQEEEEEEEEDEVDEKMEQDNDNMEAEEMNNAEPIVAPLSTSLRDQSAEERRKLEENNFLVPESSHTTTQAEREQHFRDGQKEEFIRMMEELFLEGKDVSYTRSTCMYGLRYNGSSYIDVLQLTSFYLQTSFDYKQVDENEVIVP